MNVQEKFEFRNVQIPFSPEMHICESEELRQKRDDAMKIITYYKNKTRAKRDVTCCWFARKSSNTQ